MLLQKYLSQTKAPDTAVVAYLASLDQIRSSSPLIADAIIGELKSQRSSLKLIASENFSSLSVQLAMGNLLTDKYAEGYPYHRFYAGCDHVDTIEEEACTQVKTLFGADHAFVQPHCGADANLLAFLAILIQRVQSKEVEVLGKKNLEELSDAEYEKIRLLLCNQTLLGMGLNSGGHLTHGYKHNLSAKLFRAVAYEVDPKTELLDYQVIAKQAKEVKPLILLAGYSAYPRTINFARMREIADSVGAVLLVDMAHFAGLVAGKVLQHEENPVPYAHILTSTTHKTLRGPRGGLVLCQKEFAEIMNKACPMVMGGPLPHVMAAKALAFQEANRPSFATYARQVVDNAHTLAESLKKRGVRITTNGTDNHLLIADMTSFGLTGRQAESVLREAGLTMNRNTIPYDPRGPWYTSAVRLGSAATTTLGMKQEQMQEIADIIVDVLKGTKPATNSLAKYLVDPALLKKAKSRVQRLLDAFPLYPEITID